MSRDRRKRVAVVGMASRTPGSTDLADFWRLLTEGRTAVRPRSADRTFGPDVGGFVEGVDEFDAEAFGMSAAEAGSVDPQQRLALELAWEGLEDARAGEISRYERFRRGVFLGVMAADYADLVAAAGVDDVNAYTLTGVGRSLITSRISRMCNFAYPSMTVDTGQSSSLVAVHLACESLSSGETDLVLVEAAYGSTCLRSAVLPPNRRASSRPTGAVLYSTSGPMAMCAVRGWGRRPEEARGCGRGRGPHLRGDRRQRRRVRFRR